MSGLPDGEKRFPWMDLHALISQETGQGPLWSHTGEDLNVNFVVWPDGAGVAEHTNTEVDVLIVGIAGAGTVRIADADHAVEPGVVVYISKGVTRAIRSQSACFAYLSIHRRRTGLVPA